MRQGIIIFADTPAPGSPAEQALKSAVEAGLATQGVTTFLAYADANASQSLRKVVGGPPPRFFPQATRNTRGERMAQAFAFLFVQDFERVVLVIPNAVAPPSEHLAATLGQLDDAPVVIESGASHTLVALRRADFPQVAAIFEDVAWEKPDAKENAERVLAEATSKS